MNCSESIKKEADAFNQRIDDRTKNGFVPDLQNLTFNPFFYKSFWRDPHFTKLYMGNICNHFIKKLKKYCCSDSKILDLGCGAGYLALEFAREGFDVMGIDISSSCIEIAQKTLDKTSKDARFGKLEYHVGSVDDLISFNKFDAVICSGVLHHLTSLSESVDKISACLNKSGVLLCYEPQHEYWTKTDAAFVTVLRLILANINMWHDENLSKVPSPKNLLELIDNTFDEYRLERDPDEKNGQSPNDLETDRDEIVYEIERKFKIIEIKPSYSFIYRFLGGMRGEKETIYKMADLIELIDKTLSRSGIFNANYFYATAIKR